MTRKTLVKKIKKIQKTISDQRDILRDLLEEATWLDGATESAKEDLEHAIDTLSERL